MSQAGDAAARLRAARLVRWYPRQWRERYGDEFTELLVSDIAERPDSLARAFDVARGGLLARLAGAGLAGFALAGRPGDAGNWPRPGQGTWPPAWARSARRARCSSSSAPRSGRSC